MKNTTNEVHETNDTMMRILLRFMALSEDAQEAVLREAERIVGEG